MSMAASGAGSWDRGARVFQPNGYSGPHGGIIGRDADPIDVGAVGRILEEPVRVFRISFEKEAGLEGPVRGS